VVLWIPVETRKIRPSFQVVTCAFCHRTLLRGETSDPFYLDGEAKIACVLCQPAALRGGWRRERETKQRETRPATGGANLLDRLRQRNNNHSAGRAPEPPPRRVTAQPTGPIGRVKAAVEEFNSSPLPETVSGIANSLGEPKVFIEDYPGQGVEILVMWDLCWYRWRVESGPGGAAIVERERGSELDDLSDPERLGNARAEGDGTVHILT